MKKISTLTMLLMLYAFNTLSQTLSIDLSKTTTGETKILKYNGASFNKVKILSTFPRFDYHVLVKTDLQILDPISIPSGALRSDDADSIACNIIVSALDNFKEYLKTGEDEQEIKKMIVDMDKLIKDNKDCKNEQLLGAYANLKLKTVREETLDDIVERERGKDIIIIISRGEKVWRFIIEGEPVGQWLISYGFGVSSLKGQKEYFSKAVPDTTLFQITKQRDNDRLDLAFTPAVFFSFLPYQRYNKAFFYSITGGLGFDMENPVFHFGLSGFYRQNIGLSTGVSFQQRAKLRGIYNENDIIKETLNFEQLHEEKYRPLFFIAVNFRLNENPLKTKKDGSDKEETD